MYAVCDECLFWVSLNFKKITCLRLQMMDKPPPVLFFVMFEGDIHRKT